MRNDRKPWAGAIAGGIAAGALGLASPAGADSADLLRREIERQREEIATQQERLREQGERLRALEDAVRAVGAGQEAIRAEGAAADGARLFRQLCAPCHGREGDGRGPAAPPLRPPPADFTRGLYKFRSTASGSVPTDDDLFRTVSKGVPGTVMPAWDEYLGEDERHALVAHLKRLSPRFARTGPGAIVGLPTAPRPPRTAESAAEGRMLYEDLGCGNCHGPSGRGDGPSAPDLRDSDGRPIRPSDLTRGPFRSGETDADIFRTIRTGLDGTPMPSYADSLDDEQTWRLIDYLTSLAERRGPARRVLDWFLTAPGRGGDAW